MLLLHFLHLLALPPHLFSSFPKSHIESGCGMWSLCRINLFHKDQDVWLWLCFGNFCPCFNNSTWKTNCFNIIKCCRTKKCFNFLGSGAEQRTVVVRCLVATSLYLAAGMSVTVGMEGSVYVSSPGDDTFGGSYIRCRGCAWAATLSGRVKH